MQQVLRGQITAGQALDAIDAAYAVEYDGRPTVSVSLDEGAHMPTRAHDTDAGADLYSPVDCHLMWLDSAEIHTGVHVEIPHGYVGLVMARSSMYVQKGVLTSGVVDEGYTGEIRVRLYNTANQTVHIHAGDRIAQLVLVPVMYARFLQVAEIAGGARGDAGFGSTGA